VTKKECKAVLSAALPTSFIHLHCFYLIRAAKTMEGRPFSWFFHVTYCKGDSFIFPHVVYSCTLHTLQVDQEINNAMLIFPCCLWTFHTIQVDQAPGQARMQGRSFSFPHVAYSCTFAHNTGWQRVSQWQWVRSSPSVSLVLVSNLRQVLLGLGFGIRICITLVWHCCAPNTEIHLCAWRWLHSV
jgi:hypothetical protein